LINILSEGDLPVELLAEKIGKNELHHVRHEGIHVSEGQSLFPSSEHKAQFFSTLQHAVENKFVPHGYGTLLYEWKDGHYPINEDISIGNRGSRQLTISLEHPIWLARARLWAQALHTLTSL